MNYVSLVGSSVYACNISVINKYNALITLLKGDRFILIEDKVSSTWNRKNLNKIKGLLNIYYDKGSVMEAGIACFRLGTYLAKRKGSVSGFNGFA